MSKKIAVILLIVLTITGSFINFYASNLLFSDLSNVFYGFNGIDFISSLPMFFLACDFVLAILYIIRTQIRPESLRIITHRFLRSFFIISVLGFISSLLSGSIVYHDFLAPYPFTGYSVLFTVIHLTFLIAALLIRFFLIDKIENNEPLKRDGKYYVHMIFSCLIVFFSLNRFGALLWSPVYVHTRTLYLTLPFYISLLLPLMLLIHSCSYIFDFHRQSPISGIVFAVFILVLDIILGSIIFTIGLPDQRFIAAISPALPLERLATMPIDTIFLFGFVFLFSAYEIAYSIKLKKDLEKVKE